MIYERVLMLLVLCRCKGYCLYKYLEGRQGASTKRANSDFPCQAWKIVISPFNHPGRIWQNSAGHVSPLSSTAAFHRFPPVPHSAAICGNLGQSGAICLCRLSDSFRCLELCPCFHLIKPSGRRRVAVALL